MTLSVLGTVKDRQTANWSSTFYNSFKPSFGSEKYVIAQLGYKDLKRTAQFRMSSHKYNIETGRYGPYHMAPNMETFSTESTVQPMNDKEPLELLKESPFFEPIVKDEFHVLNSCSRYADAKTKVKDTTAQLM